MELDNSESFNKRKILSEHNKIADEIEKIYSKKPNKGWSKTFARIRALKYADQYFLTLEVSRGMLELSRDMIGPSGRIYEAGTDSVDYDLDLWSFYINSANTGNWEPLSSYFREYGQNKTKIFSDSEKIGNAYINLSNLLLES